MHPKCVLMHFNPLGIHFGAPEVHFGAPESDFGNEPACESDFGMHFHCTSGAREVDLVHAKVTLG